MTATLVGTYSVGECLPIAAQAKAGIDAAVAVEMPSLQGKLDGALAAKTAITLNPPTLATQLEAAQGLVAQLQAAIELGLPNASVDASAMAAVIAELEASLGTLQAQATLSAAFAVTLGGGAVHLIVSEGKLSQLGEDVQAVADAVGPGSLDANAVVLLSVDAGTWAAIQAAVRTVA